MLSAVSIEPAPSPKGIAKIIKIAKLCESEKPSKASAVRRVHPAVRRAVPNFLISRALRRLDIVVPIKVTVVITPPREIGRPYSV